MREVQAEIGNGWCPGRPSLFAAVPNLAVVAPDGRLFPGQRPQLPEQSGVVGLDQQQVVGFLVLDQEPGVIALGVHGVGGHCHSGQVERLQPGGEVGDLVGLVRHSQVRDCLTRTGHRGQQMGGRHVGGV